MHPFISPDNASDKPIYAYARHVIPPALEEGFRWHRIRRLSKKG